jgi:hypothetical protein
MKWVLPNPLPQGITVQGLKTCRTSCRLTCCMPLQSWCAKTATCRLWSRSTTAPTACWPAVGTGSTSRLATGPKPSLPAVSSPAWNSQRRQRSPAAEDNPLGRPKRSPSAGHPWSHRRHAWPYWGRLQQHPSLCLGQPLLGHHHHLSWGPEPFFLPSARGFLYARAPPRRSSPPHRLGGCNDRESRWSH